MCDTKTEIYKKWLENVVKRQLPGTHVIPIAQVYAHPPFYKRFRIAVTVSHIEVSTGWIQLKPHMRQFGQVAKAQIGNPTYRPYLNRVIELMRYLQEKK